MTDGAGLHMTGTLAEVAAAAIVFVVSHIALAGTPLRAALAGRLGVNGFRALFSTIALATIVWLAVSHSRAPYVELWPDASSTRGVPLLVMPFASILLVAGLTTRNPTAAGFEALARFPDPAPGILKVTRHPVMWALALWAGAHIPANGDAASLILFGSLLMLALVGMPLIDRKKRASLGDDWTRLAVGTSNLPLAALVQGRARVTLTEIGWWRILAGLALYVAFLFGHEPVIGLSPLPG